MVKIDPFPVMERARGKMYEEDSEIRKSSVGKGKIVLDKKFRLGILTTRSNFRTVKR